MFDEYMGGSNHPGYGIGVDLIAEIYEKEYEEVDHDIDLFYEQFKVNYYAKRETKTGT